MLSTGPAEKWYYDACALDSMLETFSEIINKSHQSITSHLAIGEGYSNCLLKGGKVSGYDVLDSFIGLLKRLQDRNLLKIVGNDEVESIMVNIREHTSMLSITDSLHVATALREGCCIFRTIDNDFNSLTKAVCEKLAHQSGIAKFAISPMSSKSRDQLFRDKKRTRNKDKN